MASLVGLDPAFRPYVDYLLRVAQANKLGPVVTSGYRSYSTQAQLYRRYLAGQSRYPAAPPGHSKHQYGLAVDIDLPQAHHMLAALGAFWQRMGGVWGGVRDPVHFEAP